MKKIKLVTIILAIVLVTMISFFGIYTQTQNKMENQVKDYKYAMDLEGSRNIKLTVSAETKTTIKDAEGNVVEDSESLTDEEITEKGYTKEETPYNSEEVKNIENYKASQKVIKKRLKALGVSNYIMKLDETTGDIVIELTDDDNIDNIISNIVTTGKFEIVDSETYKVLMDNKDIKLAKVMYGSDGTTTSGTVVYLDIEFTKEGTKKLEEISSTYVATEVETSDENLAKKAEAVEVGTETDVTEDATETKETTTVEKKITMLIDDEEIMSTSFEEPVKTGKLQLSVGSSTTDTKTLQGYIEQASNMATVLDTGKIPVKYNLDENQFVMSDITEGDIQIVKIIMIVISIIGLIILIIRYKFLGILGAISHIGLIAVLMLVIRYANVVLSIEGIFGIMLISILNYILVYKMLTRKSIKNIYKNFILKILPVIMMVITFCFINWTPISSFGMVMFWGIILILIYNMIITKRLLKTTGKE